jgi:hypothetical protein
MDKEDYGGQQEYDKGIHTEQGDVLAFSSQKGRKGEVDDISLPFNPLFH